MGNLVPNRDPQVMDGMLAVIFAADNGVYAVTAHAQGDDCFFTCQEAAMNGKHKVIWEKKLPLEEGKLLWQIMQTHQPIAYPQQRSRRTVEEQAECDAVLTDVARGDITKVLAYRIL